MKRENDRLDLLQEIGNIGIWEYYFDTDRSWASKKVFELYGEDNIDGGFNPDLVYKYATEESRNLVDTSFHRLINESIPYTILIEINNPKTKKTHYLESTARVIYNEDGSKEKIFGVVKDITVKQTSRYLLEEANENFKSALEESAMPIMLHTEDGKMKIISKSCLEMTGYSFDEIDTRDKLVRAFHPNREDYNSDFIAEIFKKGVTMQGEEETVITKDGKELKWEFYNAILPKKFNNQKALITIGMDVTEQSKYKQKQNRMYDKLKKSQILLQASLESPKDLVILSFDLDYNYYYFNKRHKTTMKQMYGSDVEIGKNILDCITVEEDRTKIFGYYERALKGESFTNVERYGPENDLYFESTYSPIYDEKNQIIGLSVFASDITDRVHEIERIKESEEKFRLIYSSMSQGLAVHKIITDKDGKPCNYQFMDVNESYLKLFNYKREDVIGKKVLDIAPKLEQYWIDVFGSVALTGEAKYYENYSRTVDKYFSTYAYSTKKGQFAVLISDITDRVKRDKEIEYLSYNDQLTGVYNRRYYEDKFVELDSKENLPLSLIMGDVNGLKLVNDSFGHLVGDELLRKVAAIMKKACRSSDIITRIGGDEFVILLPNTSEKHAEQIIDRINQYAKEEKAESIDISISFGFGTKTKTDQSLIELFVEIEDEMYRKKLYEGTGMRSKTIDLIMQTLYEKNEREMFHSKRVSLLSEFLGVELGLDKDTVNQIKTAGLMHDIGKIGISEAILNKEGTLDDSEWVEVKKHSEIGYRILSSLTEFSEVANHVLSHHEKWDGSGYPKGLKGELIPVQARIISITDAYDAMTGPRPYKPVLTKEEAIDELYQSAGTQFDPKLVKIFIEKVLDKDIKIEQD